MQLTLQPQIPELLSDSFNSPKWTPLKEKKCMLGEETNMALYLCVHDSKIILSIIFSCELLLLGYFFGGPVVSQNFKLVMRTIRTENSV